MSREKIGVLLVGLNGTTANTTVAGSLAIKNGLIKNCDGMLTETEIFSHLGLVGFNQFVIGGWDVNGHDAYNAAISNKGVGPGNWTFHCHFSEHMMDGMFGVFIVSKR